MGNPERIGTCHNLLSASTSDLKDAIARTTPGSSRGPSYMHKNYIASKLWLALFIILFEFLQNLYVNCTFQVSTKVPFTWTTHVTLMNRAITKQADDGGEGDMPLSRGAGPLKSLYPGHDPPS